MATLTSTRTVRWYHTTVGKKVIVGVTGLVWVLYLLVHLVGNLNLWMGREAINHYAQVLRTVPELLWIARFVLAAAFVVHMWFTLWLWLQNRAARPEGYRKFRWRTANYASRTMILSGPIIFFFVLYHLGHLTLGVVGPEFREGDVYANMVAGFQVWYIAGLYIIANALIGLHLYHGAYSFTSSLGWLGAKYAARRRAATAVALFIGIGNVCLPLSVLTGIVG